MRSFLTVLAWLLHHRCSFPWVSIPCRCPMELGNAYLSDDGSRPFASSVSIRASIPQAQSDELARKPRTLEYAAAIGQLCPAFARSPPVYIHEGRMKVPCTSTRHARLSHQGSLGIDYKGRSSNE